MAKEIRVPTLGESVTEATIAKWFKKEGDAVKADEPLVELETDKVTLEVPSPAAGRLSSITIAAGETVNVGALLGRNRGRCRGRLRREACGARDRARQGCFACAGREAQDRHPAFVARRAQDGRREQARCFGDRRQRQGRPHHQGRCDRGNRQARQDRSATRDAGSGAAHAAADGAAIGAARRCEARRAGEDDAPAPDDRAPAQGCPEQRRHAHHLQRGGHERGHGIAQRSTRNSSRRSTAPSSASWASS